jgi:hypothetical protein
MPVWQHVGDELINVSQCFRVSKENLTVGGEPFTIALHWPDQKHVSRLHFHHEFQRDQAFEAIVMKLDMEEKASRA